MEEIKMLCYSFIAVMLMASLFNFGDAAVTFTLPAGGDASTTLAENSAVGAAVATIAANSDGTLGAFVLVTTGSPFALAAGGALTVSEAVLDFETTPTYTLLIRGQDDVGGGSSATATLTVSLTDINEAPSFAAASYDVCVLDGKAVGETVTIFTATDPDAGDSVTYSITSGDDNDDFDVSSANLTVAKVLDRSTTASYTLAVQASDGTLSGSANFAVTVQTACNGASVLASSLTALLIGLVYTLN